jgi:hypothetical protein
MYEEEASIFSMQTYRTHEMKIIRERKKEYEKIAMHQIAVALKLVIQ